MASSRCPGAFSGHADALRHAMGQRRAALVWAGCRHRLPPLPAHHRSRLGLSRPHPISLSCPAKPPPSCDRSLWHRHVGCFGDLPRQPQRACLADDCGRRGGCCLRGKPSATVRLPALPPSCTTHTHTDPRLKSSLRTPARAAGGLPWLLRGGRQAAPAAAGSGAQDDAHRSAAALVPRVEGRNRLMAYSGALVGWAQLQKTLQRVRRGANRPRCC